MGKAGQINAYKVYATVLRTEREAIEQLIWQDLENISVDRSLILLP